MDSPSRGLKGLSLELDKTSISEARRVLSGKHYQLERAGAKLVSRLCSKSRTTGGDARARLGNGFIEFEAGRGDYVQRLVNDEGIREESHPRPSGGAPWKEIPFIIPAQNNDPCVESRDSV